MFRTFWLKPLNSLPTLAALVVLMTSIATPQTAEAQRRCLQIAELGMQSCKTEALADYYTPLGGLHKLARGITQ